MLLHYIKRGAWNSFFYALSSVLVRGINLCCLPFFLQTLTLIEFGIWDFYQTIFSLGTLLLSSCTATAMIRFYLLHKDEPELQQQAIGNALLVTLLGTIVAGFCIVCFIFLKAPNYIIFTLASVIFFSYTSLIFAYLRMKEYVGLYLFSFCGQNVVATVLTLFGVYKGWGVISFFYANLCSFSLFLPIFIKLFLRNKYFSWYLAKQQALYSIPLLLYAILYTYFVSIDRFFIKYYIGYEYNGIYSLLWRFGAIFQFGSIALMDAAPIVFYNAQREKSGNYIIQQLITYICILLTTGALVTLIVSHSIITVWFPEKYSYLLGYLPLFFLPIVLLEVARLFHIGCGLSNKTFYAPMAAIVILLLQTLSLYCIAHYGLNYICCANAVIFLLYCVISMIISKSIYATSIIDTFNIIRLGILFFGFSVLLQLIFSYHLSGWWLYCLLCIWLLSISKLIISDHEKKVFVQKVAQYLSKYIYRKKKVTQLQTILYLRTDICSDEIKIGGSVTHTLGVINGFIKKNITIVCASSAMQSILYAHDKITFFQLKVWPFFFFLRWKLGYLKWRLDCLFSNLFFTLQIRTIFKNSSIDYLYQRYSLLNCVGVIISWWKKIPLILEYNGSEVWCFSMWGTKHIFSLRWISELVEYINIYAADYIVVVSQVLQDDLIQKGVPPEKILVNPNGVDVEQFNALALQEERLSLRTTFNLESKFVFGFVGTFSHWHGIELLAEIIPQIIQQKPQAHFILIGDGPLKSFIQQKLTEQKIISSVIFTGAIDHAETKKYLSICDAFLSPTQPNKDGSRFFGSPTKIFEYLSMGKPIIASDLEQLSHVISPSLHLNELQQEKDITIDEHVGILVNPSDTHGFVIAACKLTEFDDHIYRQLSCNARNKAVDNYTWLQHVEQICQFVQK